MKCNIENLCDSLVNFYNTSVLSIADKDFKNACFEEATKCAKTEIAKKEGNDIQRKVLMKLIENYKINQDSSKDYRLKKPIALFIGGPCSLTMQWSEEYKKLIYIFGEYHNDKIDCKKSNVLIEDYMWQMIKNSDAFIDFYIEMPGYTRDRYKHLNTRFFTYRLQLLWKRFFDCVQKYTRDTDADCNLSRVHYFDIRQSEGINHNSMSLITIKMINETIKINESTNKKLQIQIIRNIFNSYAFSSSEVVNEISQIKTYNEYLEFWKKQLIDFEFLNKKVVKATQKEARKINEFIDEQIELGVNEGFNKKGGKAIISAQNIISIINKYIKKDDPESETPPFYDFTEINDTDLETLLKNIDLFVDETSVINSIIPDKYLLLRIFKKFKVESDKRPTDEPENPHNIVIYSGIAHSDRIRTFLDQELNFKTISYAGRKWPKEEEESEPEYKNCIDMKEFPQPFFSHHPDVNWINKSLPLQIGNTPPLPKTSESNTPPLPKTIPNLRII